MARIQDVSGNPVLENVAATGAFTALNDEALVLLFGQSVAGVQVSALAGTITIIFEGSVDGTNYQSITGTRKSDGLTATSTTANGVWSLSVGGLKKFRARVSAIAGGTATANVNAGQGTPEPSFGGAVTVSGTVTVDSELPAAAALADATANPTVPGVGSFEHVFNGATWDRLRGDTSGAQVQGTVAHDGAIAGKPVRVGARASTTEPTAVADGDAVDLIADLNGKLVTQPYSVPERSVDGKTASIVGTGDTQVIAAPGASLRNYITQIIVTNGHATVGTYVNLKSAATTRVTGFARALGGGFTITYLKPLRLGVNEALNAANETTASDTRVSASGFIGP